MKLSEYDKVIGTYKMYISDFWYRWPQVRSFSWPPHYKSMGKNQTPCFILHLELIWMKSNQVRYLLILQVKFLVGDPSKGHRGKSRSPTQILTLTFQCQIIHGSTRLDKTNTNKSQSLFYLWKQRRYRRKNILVKFDLLTSGGLKFDLSLKMTEVIWEWFFRAFERRFPFCTTMRRSRDTRVVFKHPPPPPPSGGGKSRGPSGRRLKKKVRLRKTCK